MKRKFFFAFSIAAALLVLDNGIAYSQEKKQDQPQTCEELIAKPPTEEQLKKLSEKDRKEFDAEFKRCKDAVASNQKAKNANEIVNRVNKEGASAMDSKNYDVAIAKFDEGYNADPDFWGSAPVMLRNKAIALRARGIDKFNAAVKNPDKDARKTGEAEAGKDFQASVDALQRSLEVLSKSTVPTNPAQAKNFEDYKTAAIIDRVESYRLLLKAVPGKAEAAVPAIQEYLAIEQDPAKKQKAQLMLAQAYFASDFDKAIPEYKKVLATEPNNPDALYDLASAMISIGDLNNDKAMKQEGIKYMEQFVKSAPSGYDQAKLKDAKDQIDASTASAKEPTKPASTKRKN